MPDRDGAMTYSEVVAAWNKDTEKLREIQEYVDSLGGLPGSTLWRLWKDISTIIGEEV